jgi:hypothetical protein
LESQIARGRYKPTNEGSNDSFIEPAPTPSGFTVLGAFDGSNPNGRWKLYVMDDAERNHGQWSLTITARVPA